MIFTCRICVLYLARSPNFTTLGQGVHENGLSHVGHSNNEMLGDTPPPEYDMIRRFHLPERQFFFMLRLLWALTISTQIRIISSESCNAMQCRNTPVWTRLKQVFHVLGGHWVSMGKFSYKSGCIISFLGVSPYKENRSAASYELTTWKLYLENMLSSVLLDTPCY